MAESDNLFGRLISFAHLCESARKAAAGCRRSEEACEFLFGLEPEVLRLQEELRAGSYRPGEFRQFVVQDPKYRQISAAPFRDRVVHHALCSLLEPDLERRASDASFACRKNKGTHAALSRARSAAGRYRFFLKMDINAFFRSVDHKVLKVALAAVIRDRRALSLACTIVDHVPAGYAAGKGLPIGNLTSQHFANFYLAPLDRLVSRSEFGGSYTRYMDDLLFFADTKVELHAAGAEIEEMLRSSLRLELNPQATRLAPVTDGVPFLGFRLFPGIVRLSRRNAVRFARRCRRRQREFERGEIDEAKLVRCMSSLVAHTDHAATRAFRRHVLCDLTGAGRRSTMEGA